MPKPSQPKADLVTRPELLKVIAGIERTLSKFVPREILDQHTVKLDKIMALLDYSSGEISEIRRSLAIQSSMPGEYRRRLEDLEQKRLQ